MKIVIVTSAPLAGMVYSYSSIALSLKKRGHDVIAVTYNQERSPGLIEEVRSLGLTVRFVNQLSKTGIAAVNPFDHEFSNLIEELAPDIVHTFGPVATFQGRRRSKKDTAKRVTMIEAMGHNWRFKRIVPLGAFLLNRYSDSVFGICSAEVRRLRNLGVEEKKLGLMFNPTDIDRILAYGSGKDKQTVLASFDLSGDSTYLICAANFEPRKRHDLIIRAYAKLCRGGNILPALVLCGDGEELDACKSLAEKLGVREKVIFTGHISADLLYPALKFADVVLHASNVETFGWSMVEPLVFNSSCVFAETGIATELKEAGVARVVPPDDEAAFSAALAAAIEEKEQADVFEGPRSAFVRSELSDQVVIGKLEVEYERILRG